MTARIELVGRTFGLLTVVEFAGVTPTNKQAVWKCKCECGELKAIRSTHLIQGLVRSCGCLSHLRGSASHSWKGWEEISGHRWATIKGGARSRSIKFAITIKYAWELFLRQGRKCVLSGVVLKFSDTSASLDRKDSAIGYIDSNVQWVHKDLNIMKHTMSDAEFVARCVLVVNHHSKKEQGVKA